FLHRNDEHRAGDGAAKGRRVEVRDTCGRDVEGAALQGGEPLGDELAAAVDQPRLLGAVLERAPRNLVVVLLVGLPEIRRVCVRNRALLPHPVERGAGVESARERDADSLAGGQVLKDVSHYFFSSS